MSLRKRGRKQKKQQTLAFEPVAQATNTAAAAGSHDSWLGKGLSPARVRVSSPSGKERGSSSPSGSRLVKAFEMARTKKSKKQQQTLETSLDIGKAKQSKKQSATENDDSGLQPLTINSDVKVRRRVAASPPPSSFMPKSTKGARRRKVVDSDSESSVEEDGGVGSSDGDGPLKQETPRRAVGRPRKIVRVSSDSHSDEADDDDDDTRRNVASSQSLPNQAAAEDDSDDQPLVTPRSSMPRRRALPPMTLHDSDDNEEDDAQSPAKRRRIGLGKSVTVSPSSDSNGNPSSQDKSKGKAISAKGPSSPSTSTARSMRSKAPRRHRTEKEKRMELLRRRRAGEKDLTMEDLESSDEDDEQGALYDTDPELEVLEVFDDESEPEQAPITKKKGKKKAKKNKAEDAPSEKLDEDANTEDENFIDDEDDTIGVPDEALAQIPLEFTRASRKPLKAHFKDAIEWLVHRKLNPAFDRDNEVYMTAWRRLSDEVTGLANSKFVSSVWKPDFYKALRARPYIIQQELGAGFATDFKHCEACGRSGHPATWSISFQGKPYDSKTLDEVESDSEDEDEEGGDRDAEGNTIPPEDKAFFVGQTCNSNAGTAHNLIHWKPALRDWVDDRLQQDGWLAPEKIVEREKMKSKKRYKLADEVVELWDQCDFLRGLFLDFKQNIETARNMDPTKVARGARRY